MFLLDLLAEIIVRELPFDGLPDGLPDRLPDALPDALPDSVLRHNLQSSNCINDNPT